MKIDVYKKVLTAKGEPLKIAVGEPKNGEIPETRDMVYQDILADAIQSYEPKEGEKMDYKKKYQNFCLAQKIYQIEEGNLLEITTSEAMSLIRAVDLQYKTVIAGQICHYLDSLSEED
jgi:hypothetical protein